MLNVTSRASDHSFWYITQDGRGLFGWNGYVRDAILKNFLTLFGLPFVHLVFNAIKNCFHKLCLILMEIEIERDLVIGPLA